MRTDYITYGPHGMNPYYSFYFYNESFLNYGSVLNDEDDSMGWGVAFEKTGTISGFGMYVIEYQGNPDYVMGFVTVSGDPTYAQDPHPNAKPYGDLKYYNELYSNSQWQAYEPDVVGSGWQWITLDTPVNVTKGDYAAMVVMPSGGVVPDASNYVELNDESTFWSSFPSVFFYSSTTWLAYDWLPPVAFKYSDGSTQGWALVDLPWEQFQSTEEWGVEFQLPFQATCVGATFNLYPASNPGPNAPFKIILADNTDGELASRTIVDYDLVSNYNNYNTTVVWDTTTDPVLDAGVIYRLYLKPTSSEPLDKKGFVFASEADKGSFIGGTNWKWIERSTPASGWTYKSDHYPYLSVAVTNITSIGGGGGGGGTGQSNSSYGFIG